MSWADCYRVLISTSSTTAIVMFLCGAATVAAYMITLADLPNQLADLFAPIMDKPLLRSEEHTSELQSLMRISYAVFCLKKKIIHSTVTIKTNLSIISNSQQHKHTQKNNNTYTSTK